MRGEPFRRAAPERFALNENASACGRTAAPHARYRTDFRE
ncbi:hypothetical protein L810_0787 [Burkholderia sp. AU4i]|nr:hypothetical protein L810_0787 [Burkholderia sp. AU4i]